MDIKDYEAILKAEATKEHFLNIMKERAKEKNLFGFEVPTKILLTSTEFSSDNDMLTPTFKQIRLKIYKHFKEEIDGMYK